MDLSARSQLAYASSEILPLELLLPAAFRCAMNTEPQFAVTEGILTVFLASDGFFYQLRRSQVIRSLPSFASVDGSHRLLSLEAVGVLRAVIIQRQIVLNLQKPGHQECFEHEY